MSRQGSTNKKAHRKDALRLLLIALLGLTIINALFSAFRGYKLYNLDQVHSITTTDLDGFKKMENLGAINKDLIIQFLQSKAELDQKREAAGFPEVAAADQQLAMRAMRACSAQMLDMLSNLDDETKKYSPSDICYALLYNEHLQDRDILRYFDPDGSFKPLAKGAADDSFREKLRQQLYETHNHRKSKSR